MGSALLAGWESYPGLKISVLDPTLGKTISESEKLFDVIVLAVKPQLMDYVCRDLASKGISSSLFISIAAGKTLKSLENNLWSGAAIIRTMPNTPALIGQGVTVGVSNKYVSADQREQAASLLKALGHFEWLEDEKLMDAVTAVSGSGPAYVFLLIEELAKAGIAQGLPQELALTISKQTVIGAAALAAARADTPVETLRNNVTSPGGTTEAALKILMDRNGMAALMKTAVAEATKRSRELS